MYPIEDRQFREQIMWVFGLLGGELEERPLRALIDNAFRGWIRYWYTGVPSYVESTFRRAPGEFMTVLRDLSHGPAPARLLTSDGRRWRRVAQYSTSGETECPNEEISNDKCPLCEHFHGNGPAPMIYIGDGWHEVIYYTRR